MGVLDGRHPRGRDRALARIAKAEVMQTDEDVKDVIKGYRLRAPRLARDTGPDGREVTAAGASSCPEGIRRRAART